MAMFTVIGLYGDGTVLSERKEAADCFEAMHLVAVHAHTEGEDLEIMGAIESDAAFTPACDGGHSAHVDDIASNDEEDAESAA